MKRWEGLFVLDASWPPEKALLDLMLRDGSSSVSQGGVTITTVPAGRIAAKTGYPVCLVQPGALFEVMCKKLSLKLEDGSCPSLL